MDSMILATVLRYADLKNGNVWDKHYMIGNAFHLIGEKLGVGVLAIMSEEAIDGTVKLCDGFLLPGSSNNIDPAYWGGEPLDPPAAVDEYALDRKIIDAFVKAGKPIFGICGGIQGLNVYFGGSLKLVDDVDAHRNGQSRAHEINIEKDSFVYDVFGAERARVNCHHARELDRVAPNLRVVATTDDGVIEAVEDSERHIYATQWHPELSMDLLAPEIEQNFFRNFIRVCEECKNK